MYQQLPVPLKTRSENQRLQNFYSIIHPYSTYTVSHQGYYSQHVHLHSVRSIFQRMFCLPLSHLSPYHLFYELYQVSVLLVTFLLNLRHGLSLDRSHVHLSIYKRSFYQEFNKFRSDVALKTRWGKSDTLDCHIWVSRDLTPLVDWLPPVG